MILHIVSKMKSLYEYLLESSIERYTMKITLKQFIDKYIELSKLSKSKAISELVSNLNMYSDGGPNKEDWITSSQSKEISFDAHTETISGKEYLYIEIHDSSYDTMKVAFNMKKVDFAERLYDWFKKKAMINLKSYVVMKEELDGDNIQWKFDNWSKGIESSVLDAFMLNASYQKDIEGFKKLVDNSGINFNALTDMMNDDAKGLPDNYDNIYILKKIIDTINILNKGKND